MTEDECSRVQTEIPIIPNLGYTTIDTHVCIMLKFIVINKKKEICLPNKAYISSTDEKYKYGCQMHSTCT